MKTHANPMLRYVALIAVAVAVGLMFSYAVETFAARPAPGGGRRCGGFAGIPCPANLVCVDDPRDDCDPAQGGADCIGICRPAQTQPGPNAAASGVLDDAMTGACEENASLALFEVGAAVASVEFSSAAPSDQATERRGCRRCPRDRRWCECTYNGMPRASCDPCCYTNEAGILTCFD